MALKTALVVLVGLASTAVGHALPVQERDTSNSDHQLLPRVQTSITAYVDSYWRGSSRLFLIDTQNQCVGLDGTGWSNIISSVQVAPGFRCRLWDSNSCNGDSTADIYPPGAQELGSFNDKATSFKCYQN
ncbi:hypothetical protein EV127DRAFT_481196 [Xylaria flabelliformis]|nr:hypothetical protein EV127DRAFT_481196 [Xylaria flabelliformis]